MLILVPLFAMGFIIPFVVMSLDKSDLAHVQSGQIKLDPIISAKFEYARRKSCKQEVNFNDKELSRYASSSGNDPRNQQEMNCCMAFTTFNRTLHPLFSAFAHYDFKMSRFVRFTLVLGQISLITILTCLCFSKMGEDIFGDTITDRYIYVSAILGLVTLPLPRRFFSGL